MDVRLDREVVVVVPSNNVVTPLVSVIIPVLNEGDNIAGTLAPLQPFRCRREIEVILVDGGSKDDTQLAADGLYDQWITAAAGRATQMNAGAAVANGYLFWFLHADTRVPAQAVKVLCQLAEKDPCWGRFDVALSGQSTMFRVIETMINLRSRWSGISTGDQGIFTARVLFDAVGGYGQQPLMEDIELCKQLKKCMHPVHLYTRIDTSSRRWEKHGIWRTIWLMWSLRLKYFLGDAPENLYIEYYGKP